MNKVLLIGGAGFVGSVLSEELLERGYAVRILDRLYFGDAGLQNIRDRVDLIQGDMREIKPEILEDVSAVINVGGLSNDPTAEYNPRANYEMNAVATQQSAALCRDLGIKRYIYASSASIYDTGVNEEEKDLLQDEESTVNPTAAYSSSKRDGEKILMSMASDDFCPTVLRKGTIFGFSPRMRYDLVVNSFVKDALNKGYMTLHYGGEMWRPLIDVRDVARAYIACLQADEDKVRGQIFNICYKNIRISELALRVREALGAVGVQSDIHVDYGYRGVRSYRISDAKIQRVLGFTPVVSLEESVKGMVENIRSYNYTDYEHPKYYNIQWMRLLEEANKVIQVTGSVFDITENQNE